MTNGTYFSSGNHPVETLVPMLHLQSAGFEFDVFTPTGKPVKLEMWAMPKKDKKQLLPVVFMQDIFGGRSRQASLEQGMRITLERLADRFDK